MKLALFDLDSTLLNGDSDYQWGQWLGDSEWVDTELYQQRNEYFYQQYLAGSLDCFEYLNFVQEGLDAIPKDCFEDFFNGFLHEVRSTMLLAKAQQRVQWHKNQGDKVIIISATAEFIVSAIAKSFAVDDVIAAQLPTETSPAMPCLGEYKLQRLQQFLQRHPIDDALPKSWIESAYFYSDSIHDLSLLSLVEHPIAVDACSALKDIATQRNWQRISFR